MPGAFHDWEDPFLHKFSSTDIPVLGSFKWLFPESRSLKSPIPVFRPWYQSLISLPSYSKFPDPGLQICRKTYWGASTLFCSVVPRKVNDSRLDLSFISRRSFASSDCIKVEMFLTVFDKGEALRWIQVKKNLANGRRGQTGKQIFI